MSSDASIYSLLKPATALPDPLEQYGKVANLRALMGQQKLQDLQTQKLGTDIQEEQDFKSGFAGLGPTGLDDAGITRLMAISPTRGMALQKTLLENKKTQSELDKNAVELPLKKQELVTKLTAQHRDDLASVDTPEAAAQWLQSGYEHPVLGPILSKMSPIQDALKRIPTDPAAFQQWKQQQALGATKFIELNKPNVHVQDAGGTSNIVAVPGLGGAPTTLSTTTKTQSPDSVASNTTTRRGQDMTDVRAREMNGILEGQAGVDLTPTAKAIANHDIPLPNPPSGSRNPMAMVRYNELLAKVKAIDPTYNAQDYGVASKASKDFATGKQGNSVRSFNVALSHLDTLDQLGDALNNGNMPLINKFGNMVATQTGHPAPVDFNAAKKIVADEIVKAIVGSGGGVADRDEAAKTVDSANSPAQLKGVIKTYKELMRGQINGLRKQFEASGGRNFDRFLTDAAKSEEGGDVRSKADAILSGK